jgi:hypothetical protein
MSDDFSPPLVLCALAVTIIALIIIVPVAAALRAKRYFIPHHAMRNWLTQISQL